MQLNFQLPTPSPQPLGARSRGITLMEVLISMGVLPWA